MWLLSRGSHCSLCAAGAGPAVDAAGAADSAAGARCAFQARGSVAEASSLWGHWYNSPRYVNRSKLRSASTFSTKAPRSHGGALKSKFGFDGVSPYLLPHGGGKMPKKTD